MGLVHLLVQPGQGLDRWHAIAQQVHPTAIVHQDRDVSARLGIAAGETLPWGEIFRRHGARDPRDDLLTGLVQARHEGSRLSHDEMLSMLTLILVAGNETTTTLIGNAVVELLSHPGELARLRADPSLLDTAVEETLRFSSPVQFDPRRATRDVEQARKFALESFSKELLAVMDSLEMGIEAAETADADSLREGSEATLKVLGSVMSRFGIEEVDPHGEPFDPELHEAMSMVESDSAEPNSIVTVVQRGYQLNGRLLRPARVIVAKEPASDS